MTGKCIKVPKTLRWLGIGNENHIHTPSHLESDQLASNKPTRPGTGAPTLLASGTGSKGRQMSESLRLTAYIYIERPCLKQKQKKKTKTPQQ